MCCGASDAATASELKADPKLHRRLDWAAYGRWRSWKIIKNYYRVMMILVQNPKPCNLIHFTL
jgi:hypothetical protein